MKQKYLVVREPCDLCADTGDRTDTLLSCTRCHGMGFIESELPFSIGGGRVIVYDPTVDIYNALTILDKKL